MVRLLLLSAVLVAGCRSKTVLTVACRSSSECPTATPACDPTLKVCVGCGRGENSCPSGTICDEASQRCVPGSYPGCRGRQDCTFERPACVFPTGSATYGECLECDRDSDCRQPEPPLPVVFFCKQTSHTCERGCLCQTECWSAGFPGCEFENRDASAAGLCIRDGGAVPDASGFSGCQDGAVP